VNRNDRCPVTQLQIRVSVFHLNYAFRLIVEYLMVCTFSWGFLYELPFCCYKAFKSPTLFSKLRTRLPDAFHYLVSNDNFHCQTPLKNAKFDLIWQWKCQLANLVANRDQLVNCDSHRGYGMQNTIYESLSLLIGWWIHGTVCLTVLCLLILLTRSKRD